MGEIRSAIDIAMEKTEGIKGDRQAIENEKVKNSGKKAAAVFLDGGSVEDFAAETAKAGSSDRNKFIEGALPIFCAAVKLPDDEKDVSAPRRWAEGLKVLLPNSSLDALFRQTETIFNQYLEDEDALSKALERQFMPRLKAQAEELSKIYGRPVSVSLSQNAEYNAAHTRRLKALQDQYSAVINEIRGRIREAAGFQGDE